MHPTGIASCASGRLPVVRHEVRADDMADFGPGHVVGEVGAVPDDYVLAFDRLAVVELADVDARVGSGLVVNLASVLAQEPEVASRVRVAGCGVIVCSGQDVVGGS